MSGGVGSLAVRKPEFAVFVSGVASMGLEILAGRIVAPQFGSSIYTWGTIIGVFLAALSVGYYRGGKLAAARAGERRLIRLFVGTAAYVAVLVFAGDLLLRATVAFPVPSRAASLPAVVLLFGPPTYLLGFVSPYAAELSDAEGTGEASGRVYAVGTVGSILGAFGTTYALVPALGTDAIGFVFGLLLVGTAGLLACPGPSRESVGGVLGALLLLTAAIGTGAAGISAEGQVVHETRTPYQELRVVDLGDTRTLYLDGQRHSAMDRAEPTRHVFSYTRYFHLPYLFADHLGVDLDDVDGGVVLLEEPFRPREAAAADEQYPVYLVGVLGEQIREVEVAGVLEDVPGRVLAVHRAVALAVEVQRPRVAEVDHAELLVLGLGLVDDPSLWGDAGDAGPDGGRQQERHPEDRPDRLPGRLGPGQKPRRPDQEHAEEEADGVGPEGRNQRVGRPEGADDAADSPHRVDVAGRLAGPLLVGELGRVRADEAQQVGRRSEQQHDGRQRGGAAWQR